MAITSISRVFNGSPSIVFIQSNDNLTTISAPGYLSSQKENIEIINNGVFDFLSDDFCLINYANGEGFFNANLGTGGFVPTSPPAGLSNVLADGSIFVGNASNIATGVPVSGDALLSNSGQLNLVPTGVTAAAYTVNGQPLFTVDAKGRVTLASNATVTSAPSGAASGDLSGTYPSPTLAKINGVALDLSTLNPASFLLYNGTDWRALNLSGSIGVTITGEVVVIGLGNYPIFDSTPTSGNILIGNGTGWATRTMSGDGSIDSTGILTVTKTGGAAFAASATTDTTNAANISSGTLPSGRVSGSYTGITNVGVLNDLEVTNPSKFGATVHFGTSVPFTGTVEQGAYVGWSPSGTGQTIYANQKGLGAGGWEWYAYDNANVLEGIPMTLTQAGNLTVVGNLSKGSGSFKIDHPLDPTNKFLYHSFIESPDMMNVYTGRATLDISGSAIITLPSYFEALNETFTYQLTCIGGTAAVYISQEVSGNQFSIAGGTSGLVVSWMVTGIRKDIFAKNNRIIPEVDKVGDEIGKYIHPHV